MRYYNRVKPRRILLLRHAQSEANVDPRVYERVPDHRIGLTPQGRDQARAAGEEIRRLVGAEGLRIYYSPYRRSRETFEEVARAFGAARVTGREEPRLREQEWPPLIPRAELEKIHAARDAFGTFFFRMPHGESGADVFDRVSTFLETLHRAFTKDDYPANSLLVTHGLTLRLFLMRWYHWPYERFEALPEPFNAHYVQLERDDAGRYAIAPLDPAFPLRILP